MPDSPPDLARLKRYFTEARDLTVDARGNSLIAIDYYDSDQYTGAELAKLAARNQPPIVINRVKPAINGIIGITEKGRSDPRAWPRNPGDDDAADAATDILRYIADFNRFKRLKQDCFLDMLVPGSGAALIGVDEDKQVTVTQVRWEEFFADPRARRRDFKDARFLGIAKWMYADDAAALYPDKGEAIEATVQAGQGTAGLAPDQSYQDRPEWAPGGSGGAWVDKKQRRLMVVEMYYRDAGWRRCVFTGSDILEEGPSPYQDHKGRPDCPIEAQSAYVKRDNSRYGAVWDMIGPQDEVNKRRSSALHRLVSKQVQVRDVTAIGEDINVARAEASKPDGVLPPGYEFADNRADVAGHLEMLQEAKAEIERMGPSPAILGRSDDASGRHLLARQQSGITELANLYGGLEDWELRVYRQCWARAKQFWTAPQFIRVTDDEDAPKFVGLNQPIPGGPPSVAADPATGMPTLRPGVLGYKNAVAEMDVDIEIDTQPDTGTIQQEAFSEIMALVGSSPIYQQQISLSTLIQLSPIPHKRSVLDVVKQAADQQQQAAAQHQQIAQAAETAKIGETQARTALHGAAGFSKTLNALSEAHAVHNDHAAAGLEKGIESAQGEQAEAAQAAGQQSDQAHQAAMQQQAQAAQQQQAAAGPDQQGS
ncbi:MAG: hypothetical protein ACR2F8_04130 [Caulobacteraceae bacterium]